MYCPNCGNYISNPNQRFCMNCGTPISDESAAPSYPSMQMSHTTPTYSHPPVYQNFNKTIGTAGPFSKRTLGFALASLIIMVVTMSLGLNLMSSSFITYYYIPTYAIMAGIAHLSGFILGIVGKSSSKKSIQEPYNLSENVGRILSIYGIILNAGLMVGSFLFISTSYIPFYYFF